MALKDELWPVLAGDVLAPTLASSWLMFRGAVWRRDIHIRFGHRGSVCDLRQHHGHTRS